MYRTRNGVLTNIHWHKYRRHAFEAFAATAGHQKRNGWRWCLCMPDDAGAELSAFTSAMAASLAAMNMAPLRFHESNVAACYRGLRHINKIVVRLTHDTLDRAPYARVVVDRIEAWQHGMWTIRSVEDASDVPNLVHVVLNDTR